MIVGIVGSACTAILPFVGQLPAEYRHVGVFLGMLAAIAGVVTTAMNQSLSPNHVSVPVEVAAALNVTPQTIASAQAAQAVVETTPVVRVDEGVR